MEWCGTLYCSFLSYVHGVLCHIVMLFSLSDRSFLSYVHGVLCHTVMLFSLSDRSFLSYVHGVVWHIVMLFSHFVLLWPLSIQQAEILYCF